MTAPPPRPQPDRPVIRRFPPTTYASTAYVPRHQRGKTLVRPYLDRPDVYQPPRTP